MRRTVLAIVLVAAVTASAFVGNDLDDDGVSNSAEDLDGDGECGNDDSDRDGLPDCEDPDDDGDGTLTSAEDRDGDGDPRTDDLDQDGTPDFLDDDDDGDGVPTRAEVLGGTDPYVDDIPGNG